MFTSGPPPVAVTLPLIWGESGRMTFLPVRSADPTVNTVAALES